MKIYPKSTVIEKTIELCQKHNTKSQEIFDVHIVATMLSNDITKIYTYDTSHFSRFEEIEVLTPQGEWNRQHCR
jgi:predicted nucleic acid-binding protein